MMCNMKHFHMKLSNNNKRFVLCVELCVDIIQNVSNNV